MNGTFCNSAEEALGHLLLGGTVIGIYSYAIFLCYAIYDYQDEKPAVEKTPIDILMKDTKELLIQLYTTVYISRWRDTQI